ncbi:hypothetical protein [Streptomyces sp. NPDC049881]|uniref:hypothetical protein n=1 Tax=Streptomyces sp. NPDC049881 TaxID=3155778 RepID=UPI003431E794
MTPDVRLVAEIDLTGPGDWREQLLAQTSHIPPGAEVEVRLPQGFPPPGLEQAIAGAFLTASRITLRFPGGSPGAHWFLAGVTRSVRELRAAEAADISTG